MFVRYLVIVLLVLRRVLVSLDRCLSRRLLVFMILMIIRRRLSLWCRSRL